MFFRAGPLSNDKVIELLNAYFVPIHLTNEDYVSTGAATDAEKAERLRIMREVFIAGENNPIRASDAAIYVLDHDGHILKALKLPDCLVAHKVVALLEDTRTKLNLKPGKPIVTPRPQSMPPKVNSGEMVLHLTARYAPSDGAWKLLPSEDWIALKQDEWKKLVPKKDAKVGDTWNIDTELVTTILSNFYPPTSNRDPKTNKIYNPAMKATVVSVSDGVVRVRLDSDLRMKHRFLPIQDDNHHVEAKVVGYVDWDSAKGDFKDLRMVTEVGTYVNDNFGVAVRLHKD